MKVKKDKCKRCGWEWYRRKPVKPVTCPNPHCRTAYWDEERQNGSKATAFTGHMGE